MVENTENENSIKELNSSIKEKEKSIEANNEKISSLEVNFKDDEILKEKLKEEFRKKDNVISGVLDEISREEMEVNKREIIKAKKESEVIEKVVENAQMDIPEAMIDTQVRQMADEFAQRLQMQGLSVEQYFQFTGLTPDRFLADMKPEAERRIKSRLALEAVVKAENIEVSDAEYEEELNKMASMYNMEVEKIKEFMGENEAKQVKEDAAVQKAVDVIVAAAVEK